MRLSFEMKYFLAFKLNMKKILKKIKKTKLMFGKIIWILEKYKQKLPKTSQKNIYWFQHLAVFEEMIQEINFSIDDYIWYGYSICSTHQWAIYRDLLSSSLSRMWRIWWVRTSTWAWISRARVFLIFYILLTYYLYLIHKLKIIKK